MPALVTTLNTPTSTTTASTWDTTPVPRRTRHSINITVSSITNTNTTTSTQLPRLRPSRSHTGTCILTMRRSGNTSTTLVWPLVLTL